ncbi:MAG TPA: 16S rRNA (cytidine(1402)-2'-O)-methyltransferase [Actinomycetota bacterium]|nr:16S rRNA (cytidine(1402)-2'-O)-methyltransferase [Actinomycetota bacterium]
MSGRLFVCATPIGNLEDVSLRLLRVLSEADVIAAEDTRRTRKLLSAHRITGQLVAYHQGNEHKQTRFLVDRMKDGTRLALVSDGGMPAISDPGYLLVQASIQAGIPVEVIPGPSAALSALVLSGLPTARFAFEGFLPKPEGEKRTRLEAVALDDRTLIFFEAPGRVRPTLEAMLEILGDRRVAVARELTKVHEEVLRGTIGELVARLDEDPRGEVVLVVEGAARQAVSLEAAIEMAQGLIEDGMTKSKAAAKAAATVGAPRRSVYEGLLGSPDAG